MAKRRDSAQIARDRRKIADRYLAGWLQADIAEAVGVSQATVSRDLKALHAEWLASAAADFDEAKARELAKVDRLEREYWEAWERSCENAETVVQKTRGKVQYKKGDEKGKYVAEQPAEASKTVKGQAGDPRFLAGVQWCIDRRCRIFGLDAPARVDLSWREEAKREGVDPDELFNDLVEQFAAAMVGAGGGGSVGDGQEQGGA